jgi:uncharacterized membrane protein
MKNWLADRWRLLTLVLLTVALAWRLVTLSDRPLWFDEAFTWRVTRYGWAHLMDRLRQDFNPPLYYLLLKGWTLVLGDSPFALRLLSVAWFVVLLASAFQLCREVTRERAAAGKDDAGLLAVLFLAGSSFVFRLSQETRMYSQAAGLMALSSWLLLRALREAMHPARWWLAYSLSATALVYTHTFGVFGVVGQAIFLAGLFLVQARGKLGPLLDDVRLRWALLAGAFVALCYLPWVPIVLDQRNRAAEQFWTRELEPGRGFAPGMWQSFVLHCFFAEVSDPKERTVSLTPLVLFVGCAAVLMLLWRDPERGSLYLFTVIVTPIVLALVSAQSMGRDLFIERYFLPFFAMFLCAAAVVITRAPVRGARWLLGAGVLAVLLFSCWRLTRMLDSGASVGFRGAANHIAAQYREGDVLVTTHPLAFFPLTYHARGRFPVGLIQPVKEYPRHAGTVALEPGDLIAREDVLDTRARRVWLVTLPDAKEDPGLGLSSPGHPVSWLPLEEETFGEPLWANGSARVALYEVGDRFAGIPLSRAGASGW